MRAPEQGKDRAAGCQLSAALLIVFWLCVAALIRRWLGWW